MYALIITDGNGYCTTHTFERQDLWDWLNQKVEFPPGAVDVDVPMPDGYPPEFNEAPTPEGGWPAGSATANITIDSTENDLALALVRDGCDEAGVFEAFVTIGDEDDEVEYADEAYLAMRAAGATPDDIYVGMYY
jgi:hypothetical protein